MRSPSSHGILPILFAALPFASSSPDSSSSSTFSPFGLKQVRYGTIAPVETLVSLPSALAVDHLALQVAEKSQLSPKLPVEKDDLSPLLKLSSVDFDEAVRPEPVVSAGLILSSHNDTVDVLDGISSFSTLEKRADDDDKDAAPWDTDDNIPVVEQKDIDSIDEKLEEIEQRMKDAMQLAKQDPDFRGVMQLDCKKSPEACRNACWWQMCLNVNPGEDNFEQRYRAEKKGQEKKRVHSGVTATGGSPCRHWPLSQRFWDRHPHGLRDRLIQNSAGPLPESKGGGEKPGNEDRISLEGDEWPMASMENSDFDPDSDKVQHSLRCIPKADNGGGGNALQSFYAARSAYKKSGKWASWRVDEQVLDEDSNDWFYVHFNFERFNNDKKWDRFIKQQLNLCHSPSKDTCSNDGLQFHLSEKRPNPKSQKDINWMQFQYDTELHSTYKMTQPGDTSVQSGVIHQYWLYIHENDNTEEVALTVRERVKGEWVEVARKKPQKLSEGDTITADSNDRLKQSIKVEKKKDSNSNHASYKIEYAPESRKSKEAQDKWRWYEFDTNTAGDGMLAEKPFKRDTAWHKAPYCVPCPESDKYRLPDNRRTADDRDSKAPAPNMGKAKWLCTFPGW